MQYLFPTTTLELLQLLLDIQDRVGIDGTSGELHQWLIDQGIDLAVLITAVNEARVFEKAALNSEKMGKKCNQLWSLELKPLQTNMRGIGQDLKVDCKKIYTVLGDWGFNITDTGKFLYINSNAGWQALGEAIYEKWDSYSPGPAPNQQYLDSQQIVMSVFNTTMGVANGFKNDANQHYKDSKNQNQQRDIKNTIPYEKVHLIAEKIAILHPEDTLRASDYGFNTNMANTSEVLQTTSVPPTTEVMIRNAVKDTTVLNDNSFDLTINPGLAVPGKPFKFLAGTKMNIAQGMSTFRVSHADPTATAKIKVTIWKKKKR